MAGRLSSTRIGIRSAAGPIMLGLAVLMVVAGCATTLPPAAAPAGGVDAPVSRRQPGAARHPASADAAGRLADSMRRSLLLATDRSWGEVLISLDGIRNHSHASPGEFAELRRLLADLLNGAGAGGGAPLRFIAGAREPVDFEVVGTAYLATTRGFDQWELYLSLRPTGEAWNLWSADGPVRVLRQPRPGEPMMDYK